jgi:hypothetical protein
MFSCTDADCPDGFVCGSDEVCRQPGFEFEPQQTLGDSNVVWMEARDVDGDEKPDLVWIEAEEGSTRGTLRVTRFIGPGETSTWEHPNVDAPPRFGDLDGDGLDELFLQLGDVTWGLKNDRTAAYDVSLYTLRNAGGGTFTALPAATLPDQRPNWLGFHEYTLGVYGHGIGAVYDGSASTLPSGVGEGDQKYLTLPALQTQPAAFAFEYLGGPEIKDEFCNTLPRVAMVFGDEDPVSGFPGPIRVSSMHCAAPGPNRTVVLPVGAVGIDGRIAFADLNDDGRSDLLAVPKLVLDPNGPDPQQLDSVWAAYGVADGSFHSDPDALPEEDGDNVLGDPLVCYAIHDGDGIFIGCNFEPGGPGQDPPLDILAVGDIVGTSKPELILNEGIARTDYCIECNCGEDYECSGFEDFTASQARIVDLDGSGSNELIVVGTTDSDEEAQLRVYRNNVGGLSSAVYELSSGTSAAEFAIGDLDGDGRDDVGIRAGGGENGDAIEVLWGGGSELHTIAAGLDLAVGIASPGREGTLDFRSSLLGAAHSGIPEDDEIGLLRFERVADRQLATPIRLLLGRQCFDESGGNPQDWLCPYTADVVAVGKFASSEKRELVVFASGNPKAGWIGDPDESGRAESGWRFPMEVLPSGVLGAGATHFHSWTDAVPLHSFVDQLSLVGDFDGDDLDEVLGLWPNPAEFQGTMAIQYDLSSSPGTEGWKPTTVAQLPVLRVARPWPYPGRTTYELGDFDDDGAVDILVVGQTLEGASVPIFVSVSGGSGEVVETSLGDVLAWSFVGPSDDRSSKFVAVDENGAYSGTFDLDNAKAKQVTGFSVPTGTQWSVAADFDLDGLIDVAFATDTGVHIYAGVPAHGSP